MVIETYDRCKAPATLNAVELQINQVDVGCRCCRRGIVGDVSYYMATVVTIVIVGTHTNSSREIVVHLVGQVHLAAIDVLLTFHL